MAVAAVVQAATAVFIAVLTDRLAKATDWYARTTEGALRLAREQYDRDWSPDLQIAEIMPYGPGAVVLRVANLAKPAALIKRIRIGVDARLQEGLAPQRMAEYPLVILVAGGQVTDLVRVESQLRLYREAYGPERTPPQPMMWRTTMSISLLYDSAGGERSTSWIECRVEFRDSTVQSIERIG